MESIFNDDSLLQSEDKPKDIGIATDHSVIILGWGTDKQKGDYWIVRNSFGKSWGNDGNFYVARGQNDFGIEEEVSGYEVRLCDEEVSRSKGECEIVEI